MISSSRILFDLVMDAVLLLIAGNETCPRPQTSEHFARVEIMKLGSIHILQNKVDLIRLLSSKAIVVFIKGTVVTHRFFMQPKHNTDAVIVYLSCPRLCFSIPVSSVPSMSTNLVLRSASSKLVLLVVSFSRVRPVSSRIVSLHAENNRLQLAVSGGLIGIPTMFDPTLCRADRLVGQVLGAVEKLPKVYTAVFDGISYKGEETNKGFKTRQERAPSD
ncbi:uncharacterized protein HD556DRAFT_172106 [Suillus plorans]|uniref:Uncharacterized protein n=1 Tax=Suillus plorans TaxID=116603 RepID=A0A9P7D9A9_9AGAM|nr:uncharacterized protein HD556DRAFT_172106 [Suillus plorans]KAG1784965.1 hypothetical protein HD556DRAFT_172106 [Suillus plorans]